MTAKTAAAALDQPMERAADLAERAIDGTRRAAHRARERLEDAGHHTRAYIRDEPVKSVLMAAAAGAAIAGLIGWLARSRRVS